MVFRSRLKTKCRCRCFYPPRLVSSSSYHDTASRALHTAFALNSLVLAPNSSDNDGLQKVETTVANIVDVLAHTPITGIGHNFEFRDAEAELAHGAVFSESRQDLADVMPDGWQATTAEIVSSFKKADETVHVNIRRQWDGRIVSVKFNFHHPVTSIAQARRVLGGDGYNRMAENLALAKELINVLYGEEK